MGLQRVALRFFLIPLAVTSSLLTGCGSGNSEKMNTASISIEVSDRVIPANSKSSTTITAQLATSAGTPVPVNTSVTFSTTQGVFANGRQKMVVKTPDANGSVSASLLAGTISGPAEIVCESGGIRQYAEIEITDTAVETDDKIAWIDLIAGTSSIEANSVSSVQITATLTNQAGEPVTKGEVTFITTLGTFSNNTNRIIKRVDNPSGIVIAALQSGNTSGLAEVVCSSPDGVSQMVTVQMGTSLTAENGRTIESITLTAETTLLTANGYSSTTINCTLYDAFGEVYGGGHILLSTDKGRFANGLKTYEIVTAETTGTGQFSLISDTLNGIATVIARANGVTQSIQIQMGEVDEIATAAESEEQTEDPTAIHLIAQPSAVNPLGSIQIDAIAYNGSGHPLPDTKILFSLDNPSLGYITSSAQTGGNGEASVIFTARQLSGQVSISVSSGEYVADQALTLTILDPNAPSAIDDPIVNPDRIAVQGNTLVSTVVRDASGDPIPNTTVHFEVENSLYGAITESVITNGGGWAGARFDAKDQPGEVNIVVSAGAVPTKTVRVAIEQAPASNIEFVSADPNVIAIKESGGNEISLISFIVKDSNDNPLRDINVAFQMDGPNGGEYIDPTLDGSPSEITVTTDAEGIAQVRLYSGYVAGPVTLKASINISENAVDPRFMTVQSSVISIGGGMPSARRFSLTSELLNLPGLYFSNRTTQLTAYLADRFGNYNVLTGTTVSFISEVGLAVDTSQVTVDDSGFATVTVRTQIPEPDYTPIFPEDVAPFDWETDLQAYLSDTYAISSAAHPRDGLVSILVYTKGEEHFNDSNSNGIYDPGETFEDTASQMFCDYNDNGQYDGPESNDPEELFINTGEIDYNGLWDANKYIFGNHKILISGAPNIYVNVDSFEVPNGGGSGNIRFLTCDRNFNPLTDGSSVTVSIDAGVLYGTTEYIYHNTSIGSSLAGHLSLIEHVFYILDGDSEETDPAEPAIVTITVEWEGITYTHYLTGTVD